MANIVINLEGMDEVSSMLKTLINKSEDLTPVFNEIGNDLKLSHRERFDHQESPDGTPWEEPEDITKLLRSSVRKGKTPTTHKKALLDQNDLMNSLDYESYSQHLAFGSNKIYAAIHQLGGKAGRGKKVDIPARPFLGVSEDDQNVILETLREALEIGFKK